MEYATSAYPESAGSYQTMTTLSPALRKAFEETQYHVLHQAPFGLQVGQPQPALSAIYQQHQTACACLITAFNPMGELLEKDENIERHAQLGRALGSAGYAALPTVAQHPANGWPAEPGFLVIGMGREDAQRWAAEWEQLAVLWTAADTVPQLLETQVPDWMR